MCPLTHVYTAVKVAGRESPLLIIGSVLSDFVWMSRKLPYDKLHDDPKEFYDFIKGQDRGMLDLVLGMLLHSNAKGADYYSHFYEGGYAFTKGKELEKDLVTLFKSEDEKLYLLKAHNFIEGALDLHLLKNNESLPKIYKEALREVDLEKIKGLIYQFTDFDAKLISEDLDSFLKIFGPKSVKSEKSFVSNFFPPILEIAFQQKASGAAIQRVLTKAKKLTEEDWEELVKTMIAGMKKDFAGLI